MHKQGLSFSAMNRRQKTSRYFLRYLLPREQLDAARRERLDSVLLEGGIEDERRLAGELAEFLVERGVFERLGAGLYRDKRGARSYRLPLAGVPASPEMGSGKEPAATAATAAETAPGLEAPSVEQDPGRLEEILTVLRIDGGKPGLLSGLDRLMRLIEDWYPDSRHQLYHFKVLETGGDDSPLTGLHFIEPDTLIPGHPYLVALEGRDAVLMDEDAPRYGWYPPRDASGGRRTLLMPLRDPVERSPDDAWGLLELQLPPDTDFDRARGEAAMLGEALSHLIRNHRFLSTVVYVDTLTGVFNRSFLEIQLPLEIERATRSHDHLAMLVIDLDDFKQVNDTYGHDAGDAVLREFGEVLRNTLRKVDMVFRFGGEEFVVLLPRLEGDSAFRAGERLREAVEGHAFPLPGGGEPLRMTVSVGGAIYPRDALSEDSLFRVADEACYKAKAGGKNQVHFVEDPPTD